jgi:ureidoglycolate lyase
MKLQIQNLSQEAFAPYGEVIELPDRPADASGPAWQWWGNLMTMTEGERPYAVGYLTAAPAEMQFDWAERHMQTDELIAPLTGDCLVYVAPPDHPDEPDRLPGQDRFSVFRVRSGQAVLLRRGVWHGAPMAETGLVRVLIVLQQDAGSRDGYVQRFEDRPILVE